VRGEHFLLKKAKKTDKKHVLQQKNRPLGRFLLSLLSKRSVVAPNLLSSFNDQTKFVSLGFNSNVVAVNGAREAALG